MEDERYQKELFELEKPKRAFPGIDKIFLKNSVGVTLSLEKLIFISIAIVMVTVIVYALGIEKGKSLVRAPRIEAGKAVQAKMVPVPVVPLAAAPAVQKNVVSAAPAMPVKEAAGVKSAPYTIIAATYSNNDTARSDAARLKKDGLDAYVVQGSAYSQVCVGSYRDKESAKGVLAKVRQRHSDAYIKLK